jgi:aquaporin NIP
VRDLRPELAEALGSGLVVLFGGAALLGGLEPWLVALASGGTVAVLVYALGHVSGAHFNPAVTLAFAATGHFPARRSLSYVAAQVAGATLASFALVALYGGVGGAVAGSRFGAAGAFAAEVAATFLLGFTILAVATDRRVAAGVSGAAIGLAVFLGGLVLAAAMNPARALGPALAALEFGGLAVHAGGPLVGAALGMGAYEGLRRGRVPRGARALGSTGPVPLQGGEGERA